MNSNQTYNIQSEGEREEEEEEEEEEENHHTIEKSVMRPRDSGGAGGVGGVGGAGGPDGKRDSGVVGVEARGKEEDFYRRGPLEKLVAKNSRNSPPQKSR